MDENCENSPCPRRVQEDSQVSEKWSSENDYNNFNEQSQQGKEKHTWTVHELLHSHFADPDWVVPDIIPIGLTALGGRPKIGKSFFGINLAIAKAIGGSFLGKEINPGKVLYFALEDRPRRIQQRLLTLKAPDDAQVRFDFALPNLTQNGFVALTGSIHEFGPSLVIVDTLSRVLGRVDQDEIGPMSDIFGKLQTLSQNEGIAILVIDHHRKSNGKTGEIVHDPVDDLLGSTGKSAPLDTALGLYRDRGSHNAKLMVIGRDVDDQTLQLTWSPAKFEWKMVGELGEDSSRKNRILEAVDELMKQGQYPTITNISTRTSIDRGNISHEISELENLGKLAKGKKVGRFQPYYPSNAQLGVMSGQS